MCWLVQSLLCFKFFFLSLLIMKILTLSWSLSVPLQPGSVSAGHGGRWLGEHQHSHDKSFLHQLSAVSHSRSAQTPHNHHSPVSTALKRSKTLQHQLIKCLIDWLCCKCGSKYSSEWILVSIACIGVLFKSCWVLFCLISEESGVHKRKLGVWEKDEQ